MGREVRQVPRDWVHPREYEGGPHKPLFNQDYESAMEEWRADGADPENEPDRHTYRERPWNEGEATCFQFYENTTEGTPESPVFASEEDLDRWIDSVEKYLAQGKSLDEAKELACAECPPVSPKW
jgi:hypothetical protein